MNGMREIICPICGGADKTVVYESRLSPAFDETTPPSPYSSHYRINRCACGLLYSSPIMDEVGVAALYEKSSETNVAPGEEDNVRRTMRLYFELAVPHLAARERVLDIGCDMGFLLEAARAAGFVELHGIEPNPVARRIAAARLPGARVMAGHFMTINQAMGVPKGRDAGLSYAREFIEDAKASGFVARSLEKSGQGNVPVAPAAPTR